jgi:DNA-directed RNA polymerase subunit RPC12/RpoP
MDGACPCCQRDLPEWPSRSGPCPYCANEILVRARPLDRERVLVTEAEAEALERQWELTRERGGASPLRPLLDERELEAERASLRIRFGREPAEDDVTASLVSHRAFEHMRRLELGGYRDVQLAKASLLDQQGREAEALAGYLGVCFLDLNGARNPPSPGPHGVAARVAGVVTGFVLDRGCLAPSVVARCIHLIAVIDLDEDQARAVFTRFCERHYETLRAPMRPHEAWPRLGDAIFADG